MNKTDPILKKYNYASWLEAADALEMEAQEWSETEHMKELAEDAMFAAAACRKLEATLKALGNCYMLANRSVTPLRRVARDGFRLTHAQMVEKDNWKHIIRFCEETGMKAEILRAQVPTEITGG